MVVPVDKLESLTSVSRTVGEAHDVASTVQCRHLVNESLVEVDGGLVAGTAVKQLCRGHTQKGCDR